MFTPEEANHFDCLFEEELDSWFSADIACCAQCFDDFCQQWPLIVKKDSFQRKALSMDVFYSGSRFSRLYSEDKFYERLQDLDCPRCGAPLGGMIWAYSFPFELPAHFESTIAEVAAIAKRTPFLVLSHPFAKKVFDEIEKLSHKTKAISVADLSFRARHQSKLKSPNLTDFLPPPPEMTQEGRYNHAGLPVLYLAKTQKTCILELGNPAEGLWGAQIRILKSLKILSLSTPEMDTEVLAGLVASSLISAPAHGAGWNKPEYVFSRFVSDCAHKAGYDAITYPSTRDPQGENLVLLNNSEEPWDEIVEVVGFEAWPKI